MAFKYEVGQRLKTSEGFGNITPSVVGIIENMFYHHKQGLHLEVIECVVRDHRRLYRCSLLDKYGNKTDDYWLYDERWLSPIHEFKSHDALNTALSKGVITDEEYLEGLKHVQ